jgi:hypothetical protein
VRRFKVRAPQVIHDTVDGEVVIVNLETGYYYSLLGSAARIWTAIEGTATVEEIIGDIKAYYQVNEGELLQAVQKFIGELKQEGLIVSDTVSGPDLSAKRAAGSQGAKQAFHPPALEKFTDMKELILLDPVHGIAKEQNSQDANKLE